MARMIPPVISRSVRSPGERELFEAFKSDPVAKDWVILHSLDIAKHRTQVTGEVDFVVIVPGQGAVFLEVKACKTLTIDDGVWIYGQNDKKDERGPFKQVSDAMHSLREEAFKAQPDLRKTVFWSAVFFTHMSFKLESTEWHRWQCFDQEFLKARGACAAVLSILKNARQRLTTTPTARWFKPDNHSPSPNDLSALISVMRPNFEAYESPRFRVARAATEAKKYTEEQYRALDYAEENPRVVFTGPAGTGKTLLAIESARRAAQRGRRTLFLCYNELLGKWLEEELRSLRPAVEFDRVARLMLKISGLKAKDGHEFWENKLPRAALQFIKEDDGATFQPYDELIVDEAQDFLRGDYIEFLNCCVLGGLSKGRVKLFGDFERQAVYQAAELSLSELKEGWIQDLTSISLRMNCRNLPRVASLAKGLGGLDPDYHKILREDDGAEPIIVEYTNDQEQQAKLLDLLLELRTEGFAFSDIAVLSVTAENMCMARIMGGRKPSISGAETPNGNSVISSSVRRFKGLEAFVVILTDVDDIKTDDTQKLLYVAVTRSITKLVIFMKADAAREYREKNKGRAK